MRAHERALPLCLALLLAACQNAPGLSVEEQALTIVAATVTAASPTPLPSNTPTPTETATPTPLPPTETPTITPTPGPAPFQDDFARDDGHWLQCTNCSWLDGVLYMGPYPPTMDFTRQYTVCEPCGAPTYFRMAVDATFVDGQTDRGFGLAFGINDDQVLVVEISPLFQLTLGYRYEFATERFTLINPNMDQIFSGLVKPGRQTNRMEIEVLPIGAGRADLFFKLNGKNAFVLFNRPVDRGQVGLVVSFHSLEAAFDNFEFEPIEP